MYSDDNRRASVRRANDEILRRMLGGELSVGEVPAMTTERPTLPEYPQGNRVRCDGSEESGKENACGKGECPTCIGAPSLAMVYAPKQCWRNLLDPQSALQAGSLFAELILPLEVRGRREETEVRGRK